MDFSLRHPRDLFIFFKKPAMTERTPVHDLQVATDLYNFVNDEVLPDVGVAPGDFWHGFSSLVTELAPKNAALLAERDRL